MSPSSTMGIADIDDFLDTISDRRAASTWYVWRSLWFCTGLIFSYLFFVLWLGPRFMVNRAPFSLKRAIIIYNFLQIVANAIYVYKGSHLIYTSNEFSIWCQPMQYHRMDQYGMDLYHLVVYFYALKILDLMDTVFMVVRKKKHQVTFLHVSHHAIVVLITWTSLRFYPGGIPMVTAELNAAVHTIMYCYYLLSALELPALLLIKPYITAIQLAQFVFNTLHLSLGTMFGSCDSPVPFNFTIAATNVLFFFLFMGFYKKKYHRMGHQGFVRKAL